MIRHGDAEHLNGGHAANVRYLWRQTYSVLALAVCEYDFGRLDPVKSQITVLRRPVTSKLWGQGVHCISPKHRRRKGSVVGGAPWRVRSTSL